MKYLQNRFANLTIACVLLACGSNVSSEEVGLETLLEQIIVAYGGEENLRKLNSHIQEWDVVALTRGSHGTDTRQIRVPDQLKVELSYPDRKETRVVNGEVGFYTYHKAPPRIATQPQKDAMRLQLMRHYSPLVLRDKLDSLSMETQGEFRVITLFEQGVRADFFINSATSRIEKVVGSLAMNGIEMQFRTEYSNFAFRDGVLVHLKENKFAGGVNTAVLQLRRITLDADLEESDFIPDHDQFDRPGQPKNEVI
jgi:hypothetical protein